MGVFRHTCLWNLLDGSPVGLGEGDNRMELDVNVEFAELFAIIRDGHYDILLNSIALERVKVEGRRTHENEILVAVDVQSAQNKGLMK